jgi:hypothetical protein
MREYAVAMDAVRCQRQCNAFAFFGVIALPEQLAGAAIQGWREQQPAQAGFHTA